MSIVYTPLFPSRLIVVPFRMFRMCGFFSSSTTMFPARTTFLHWDERLDNTRTPERYASLDSLIFLNGFFFASLWFVLYSLLQISLTRFCVQVRYMTILFQVLNSLRLRSPWSLWLSHIWLSLRWSLLFSSCDCLPYSIVALDWFSFFLFVYWFSPVTVQFHFPPTDISACRTSSLSFTSSTCSLSLASMTYKIFLSPFRYHAAISLAFSHVFINSDFTLVIFLLSFAVFLAAVLLQWILSSMFTIFATMKPFFRCKSEPFRKSIFLCRSLYKKVMERDAQFFDPFLLSYFPRDLSRSFRSPLKHLCQLPYSLMTFSSTTRSVLYILVLPLNLANIFSSSLIVSNLFPNLFMSLMNILKMTSNYSISFALSSHRIFSRSCIMTRSSFVHLIIHWKLSIEYREYNIRIIELSFALLDWYQMIIKSKLRSSDTLRVLQRMTRTMIYARSTTRTRSESQIFRRDADLPTITQSMILIRSDLRKNIGESEMIP